MGDMLEESVYINVDNKWAFVDKYNIDILKDKNAY